MAFQSLQLVVTDFLPLMPCTCIKVVVDVAGKFGLQPQELNISLTAIGLLVSHLFFKAKFDIICLESVTFFASKMLITPDINKLLISPELKNPQGPINMTFSWFLCCSKLSRSGTSPTFCRNTGKRFAQHWKKLKLLLMKVPMIAAVLAPNTKNPYLPLTASGCVCIPSWVSCALIRGPQSEKARDRRCSRPLMLMVRFWRMSRGIQCSGR